jgi:hypothetical protein
MLLLLREMLSKKPFPTLFLPYNVIMLKIRDGETYVSLSNYLVSTARKKRNRWEKKGIQEIKGGKGWHNKLRERDRDGILYAQQSHLSCVWMRPHRESMHITKDLPKRKKYTKMLAWWIVLSVLYYNHTYTQRERESAISIQQIRYM